VQRPLTVWRRLVIPGGGVRVSPPFPRDNLIIIIISSITKVTGVTIGNTWAKAANGLETSGHTGGGVRVSPPFPRDNLIIISSSNITGVTGVTIGNTWAKAAIGLATIRGKPTSGYTGGRGGSGL